MNNREKVEDLTGYDCTNLMIVLKLRTRNLPPGASYEFLVYPEQYRSALDVFFEGEYRIGEERLSGGQIHITLARP